MPKMAQLLDAGCRRAAWHGKAENVKDRGSEHLPCHGHCISVEGCTQRQARNMAYA